MASFVVFAIEYFTRRAEIVSSSGEASLIGGLEVKVQVRVQKTYTWAIAYVEVIHEAIELMVGTRERIESLVFVRAAIGIIPTKVVKTEGSGEGRSKLVTY